MNPDEVVAGRDFLRALASASERLRAKNETASR
jgi:hypothetical protein